MLSASSAVPVDGRSARAAQVLTFEAEQLSAVWTAVEVASAACYTLLLAGLALVALRLHALCARILRALNTQRLLDLDCDPQAAAAAAAAELRGGREAARPCRALGFRALARAPPHASLRR